MDAFGCCEWMVGHRANQKEDKHPCEPHYLHHNTNNLCQGKAMHDDADSIHFHLHFDNTCISKPGCSKSHGRQHSFEVS